MKVTWKTSKGTPFNVEKATSNAHGGVTLYVNHSDMIDWEMGEIIQIAEYEHKIIKSKYLQKKYTSFHHEVCMEYVCDSISVDPVSKRPQVRELINELTKRKIKCF